MSLFGLLVAALPAGAEAGERLAGCYVGAVPCGSPAEMAQLVARCLPDPALCGSLGSALPRQAPLPAAAPSGPARGTDPGPGPAVAALARALPLDPSWREVADALPPDPAAVMRRLGLRASGAAPADLRGQIPSAQDLLQALLRKPAR